MLELLNKSAVVLWRGDAIYIAVLLLLLLLDIYLSFAIGEGGCIDQLGKSWLPLE